MKIDHIYVDMDGVLVDFYSRALECYKRKYDENFNIELFKKTYPVGTPQFADVLNLSDADFWAMIDETTNFWYNLPVLANARMLLTVCQAFAPTSILTKCNRNPGCYKGKKESRDKHFPDLELLTTSRHKWHMGRCVRRILIDDTDKQVKAWRDKGGTAILYPQVWNQNHELAKQPVQYVISELARIAQMKQPQQFITIGQG